MLLQLLALLTKLGPKLPLAWPHLMVIWDAIQNIMLIISDGQLPKQLAPSPEAKQFVKDATAQGMSKEEAEKIAAGFQQVDDVLE